MRRAVAAAIALLAFPANAAVPSPHFGCPVIEPRCPARYAGQRVARCETRNLIVNGQYFAKTTMTLKTAPGGFSDEPDRKAAQSIAFIQIVPARTAAKRAFNTEMRARSHALARGEFEDNDPKLIAGLDLKIDASLVAVSRELIDIEFGVSTYSAGMAHPNWNSAGSAWSLPLAREIVAADLFRSDRRWATELATLAQGRIVPKVDGVKASDLAPIGSIADPRQWRIEPTGLRLIFDPYTLGGYLSSAVAELPWSVLRPYLVQTMPFDPAKLRSIGPDASC